MEMRHIAHVYTMRNVHTKTHSADDSNESLVSTA